MKCDDTLAIILSVYLFFEEETTEIEQPKYVWLNANFHISDAIFYSISYGLIPNLGVPKPIFSILTNDEMLLTIFYAIPAI